MRNLGIYNLYGFLYRLNCYLSGINGWNCNNYGTELFKGWDFYGMIYIKKYGILENFMIFEDV